MSDTSPKKRPAIALLIDWAENMYHMGLIGGVRSKAEELGLNLMVYVGGCINSPRKWESPRNVIYDMVNPKSISGIIAASASLGHYSTFEQISAFCKRYSPIPLVSISAQIEGIPSIVTENKEGFRKLLIHLIGEHGCKRIAFIKGPIGNRDADERFEVYKQTLAQYNITFDPDIVEEGTFVWQDGGEAVRRIFDKNKLSVDAICAANDEMAFGAREALASYGIRVPQNIAITGFDDQDLSRYMNPPLTTIKQPIVELGWKAVEILSDLINGKTAAEVTVLCTDLIIRESCGCLPSVMKGNGSSKSNYTRVSDKPVEYPNPPLRASFAASYSPIGPAPIASILANKEVLEDALFRNQAHADDSPFLERFASLLSGIPLEENDEAHFTDFIDSLRLEAEKKVESMGSLRNIYEQLNRARMYVNEIFRRRERYLNTLFGQGTRDFRDLSEEMVSIEEMEDIFHIIAQKMSYVGILSCFFSLYSHDGIGATFSSPPAESRLIAVITNKGELPIDKAGIPYPTGDLLPSDYLPIDRQCTLDVEPLFFGKQHLGLALFEFSAGQGMVRNTMQRMFINSVLKAGIFLKQVQLHSLSLEVQVQARTEALSKANELLKELYTDQKRAEDEVKRLNEDLEKRVSERTSELLETNTKLKKTLRRLKNAQAQLVQSEKMAALGGLVAGITHEINTPIGIGVTASSHLDVSINELEKLFTSGNLKKSDLTDHIAATKEMAKMILSNLNRAYELIRSFKQVAVDQTSEKKRKFKVREYMDEVLTSLKPQLKQTGHAFTIGCPDGLEITSSPGPLSQVITNLVMNSIMHAFDEGVTGTIGIDIKKEGDSVVLVFSDNGNGIKKEHMKKIYEPFFTTKRGKGGTGLGLHLVYNIVVNTLGGSIECASEEGKGTAFTIMFPA